jgi:hypothetical protein
MTRKNGEVKQNTMDLTKEEMKNIQSGIFMPHLFKPCFSNLSCSAATKTRSKKATRKTKKQKRRND